MPFNRRTPLLMAFLAAALASPPGLLAASEPFDGLRARLDVSPETEPLSERNASYAIDVELDTEAHRLTGRAVIRYRNVAHQPMEELRLHLYLNAFKNPRTTFMRESGGQLRGDRYQEGAWGYIDLTELRLLGAYSAAPETEEGEAAGAEEDEKTGEPEEVSGEEEAPSGPPALVEDVDLFDSWEFTRPDDGNPDDETVIRVELPASVPSGGWVDVAVAWEAQLPWVFARTGYAAGFHMVGQWFPKVGVYERRPGPIPPEHLWNCHQFHATSEFFSDFGIYDVRISVPAASVVGASGWLLAEPEVESGTAVHHYRAEDVHDFAFTADSDYREMTEQWNDVSIRLLYQPEHEALVDLHLEAARTALQFFDDSYGPYPYSTLTMVDPGPGGGGAHGMEYPTLITVGTRYYSVIRQWFPWLLETRMTELTLIHEFGHQYWYGMVASNEFEEAWLDEGINSYSEAKVLGDDAALKLLGGRVYLRGVDMHRAAVQALPREGPLVQQSWKYPSQAGYFIASYPKTATMLRTLEGVIGEEVLAEAMRTYFQQWRFKHPRTEDFLAVVEEVAGQDLAWFWDQFVFEDLAVDYRVRRLRSRKIEPQAGVYDRDGERVEVTAEEARNLRKHDSDETATYRTTVTLDRTAQGVLPVDWEVHFADGHVESGRWDGRARSMELEFERPARAVLAVVDPERRVLLDLDLGNNSRFLKRDRKSGEESEELAEQRQEATRSVGRFSEVAAALALALSDAASLLF